VRNAVDLSPQSLLEATARSSRSGQAGGAAIAIESMATSRNRECEQAIFRERLGEVVAPWARRTSRVEELLLLVGHRTGGRAAEFLLKRFGDGGERRHDTP